MLNYSIYILIPVITSITSVGHILNKYLTPMVLAYLLLVIALVFFGFTCISYIQRRRANLLSSMIKAKIKRSFLDEVITLIDQIYFPSLISLGASILLTSFLFWVARFKPLNIHFLDGAHYQNLIAIHAGMGAIIFALLIFVAESLREDKKDRARVLLRESFLFPLTVFTILGFFVYIWGDVGFLSVGLIFLDAILIISSLWRLLSVLLSPAKFRDKQIKLLKDAIERSIYSALVSRIGNNILHQKLGDNGAGLSYYPMTLDSDEKKGRFVVYADKNGVVEDIKIDNLEKFASLLEKEANKNGFSFYENKNKPNPTADNDQGVMPGKNVKYTTNSRQYVHKLLKDEVTEESNALMSVDLTVLNGQPLNSDLKKIAKDIFVIKKGNNISDDIQIEFDTLTDQCIVLIQERKVRELGFLIKTFTYLAEAFMDAIIRFGGGGYSYDQARKERSTIFGGWNELRLLRDSIEEIYTKAVQSGDKDIIQEVIFLPVAIAIRALKLGDQYIYQEFLRFPSILYWMATKIGDLDLKHFIVDRCWRHLKEMSDYYIEYNLKRKADDLESLQKYADFTIPVFTSFQDLIKASFDKNDSESFNVFIENLVKLYDSFDSEKYNGKAEHLRWRLDNASAEDKDLISKELELHEAREKTASEIELKKMQVIFGISAYIFDNYRSTRKTSISPFYTSATGVLPKDLEELTKIFESCKDYKIQDFWNWDNWEMIPDGEVHSINFDIKLDRLYLVLALNILANSPAEKIVKIQLPSTRTIAFAAEDRPDSSSLIWNLKEIQKNFSDWSFVVNQNAESKIEVLMDLLKKAKLDQEEKEEKYLETAELDPDKISEFKEKILKNYYDSYTLRAILQKMGCSIDKTCESPGKKIDSWGYNQLDKKAAFLKNWHVHYAGWGEQYGDGMAKSEDEIIFKKIVAGAKNQTTFEKEAMIPEIIKLSSGFKNPIVIQTMEYLYEFSGLRQAESFVSSYSQDCPLIDYREINGFMGVLKNGDKNVPVFDLFVRDESLKNKILVIDLPEFGSLNQYSPIDEDGDKNSLYDIFSLRIIDLNKDESERGKIISENPKWLEAKKDKIGYLKTHVVIKLYQKFEFTIINPEAAVCMSLKKTPDPKMERSKK